MIDAPHINPYPHSLWNPLTCCSSGGSLGSNWLADAQSSNTWSVEAQNSSILLLSITTHSCKEKEAQRQQRLSCQLKDRVFATACTDVKRLRQHSTNRALAQALNLNHNFSLALSSPSTSLDQISLFPYPFSISQSQSQISLFPSRSFHLKSRSLTSNSPSPKARTSLVGILLLFSVPAPMLPPMMLPPFTFSRKRFMSHEPADLRRRWLRGDGGERVNEG